MLLFKKKTYALVGRSGTGKSYRAQLVAAKNHIQLVIDDGLLIRGDRIIAGKSAKQEHNFISSLKCALFQDENHRNQVLKALSKEKYRKILIVGTSMRMVNQIASILNLPQISKVIKIEDISSKEQIETAMNVRYSEGKHVIPVNPSQITHSYPGIAYDTMRNGRVNDFSFLHNYSKDVQDQEKTVVKPEFAAKPKTVLSSVAIKQMASHCLYVYDNTMKIENASFVLDESGYKINLEIRTPLHLTINESRDLEEYIQESLEKYGGILVNQLKLVINEWN